MSNNLAEAEYVSQKMFDLRLDDIQYRTSNERERMDDKLDRFQAIMEKNFAEMHSMINEFRVELKGVQGDIRALDKKVDDFSESRIIKGMVGRELSDRFHKVIGYLVHSFGVIAYDLDVQCDALHRSGNLLGACRILL